MLKPDGHQNNLGDLQTSTSQTRCRLPAASPTQISSSYASPCHPTTGSTCRRGSLRTPSPHLALCCLSLTMCKFHVPCDRTCNAPFPCQLGQQLPEAVMQLWSSPGLPPGHAIMIMYLQADRQQKKQVAATTQNDYYYYGGNNGK